MLIHQRRAQILQTLDSLHVDVATAPADFRIDAARAEKTSRDVLAIMLTRRFRVGDMPQGETHAELLARVERFVERSLPIRITMGYAPMKNMNAVRQSRADWGELFALWYLATLHNRVHEVYPPGLQFRLIFDDTVAWKANRAPRKPVNDYINSIRRLIKTMHLDGLIVRIMRHSYFSWLFNFGFYQVADRNMRRWSADPENAEQLEKMNEYASRNVLVPAHVSESDRADYTAGCAHRFRVYWEAMRLSGLAKLQSGLIAMYLDGKQHHIQQPCALHLKSVSKGQWTQPWEGEGMLLDNGHGKLVPFVLTHSRQAKYTTELAEDLTTVPLPGFDQIRIATEIPLTANE